MSINLKVFLQDSRARIFYLLCLLWLTGILQQKNLEAFLLPFFSIILFGSLDFIFTLLKTKKPYFPFSSFVSGLLIGLLLDPSSGILVIGSAVIFGFISKHFIKIGNRHIFNPAALGVFLSSLIFNTPVSWWAASFHRYTFIIPALSIYTLYKLKRLQLPFLFLVGFLLFLSLTSGIKEAFSLTFDGTIFLFSFIMLPEPMTSTTTSWWRYGFSLVVLGIIILSHLLHFSFADPLLFALLITNLLGKLL